MALILVVSVAAPLIAGVAALLWGGFVGRGMGKNAEAQLASDMRTW